MTHPQPVSAITLKLIFIIAAIVIFIIAAILTFGWIGSVTVATVIGLIALGLAVWAASVVVP